MIGMEFIEKKKDEVYVEWDEFKEYDSIQRERIIKNCCR